MDASLQQLTDDVRSIVQECVQSQQQINAEHLAGLRLSIDFLKSELKKTPSKEDLLQLEALLTDKLTKQETAVADLRSQLLQLKTHVDAQMEAIKEAKHGYLESRKTLTKVRQESGSELSALKAHVHDEDEHVAAIAKELEELKTMVHSKDQDTLAIKTQIEKMSVALNRHTQLKRSMRL